MNTSLKRTTIVLSVIVCFMIATFGGLISTNHNVAVADETVVLSASDIILSVEEKAELEAVASKPAAAEAPTESNDVAPEEELWVEEEIYYEVTYDEDGERYLVPYDGSGHYNANLDGNWYQGSNFEFDGRYKDGSGYSFTWYPEKVLPGGGLNIPGRHVGDEGYICDENGNVCLSSDNLPPGTVVDVPFGSGTGVVYDSGSGDGNIDVYVSW